MSLWLIPHVGRPGYSGGSAHHGVPTTDLEIVDGQSWLRIEGADIREQPTGATQDQALATSDGNGQDQRLRCHHGARQ